MVVKYELKVDVFLEMVTIYLAIITRILYITLVIYISCILLFIMYPKFQPLDFFIGFLQFL